MKMYALLAAPLLAFALASGAASDDDMATVAPMSPTNLAVQSNDAGVLLTWDAVDAALSYDVYRSDTGESITEVMGTEFIDTAMPSATGYFVTACDAFRVCSVPSESVRLPDAPIIDAGVADDPAVPSNVTYVLNVSGGATINFDAVVGAVGYLLHINGEFSSFTIAGTSFMVDAFDVTAIYQVSAYLPMAMITHPGKSVAAIAFDDTGTGGGTDDLAVALNRIAELELALATATGDLTAANATIAERDATIVELRLVIDTDADGAELQLALNEASVLIADQTTLIADQADVISELETRAGTDAGTIAQLEADLRLCLASDTPADDTPTDEAPVDETPVDEAPAEETPVGDMPPPPPGG